MAAQEHAMDVPPVEVVLSEFVMNLAALAHAYLDPPPGGEAKTDLAAAEIAIDVAGKAFDRIEDRLEPQDRSMAARVLTQLRLSYVEKRSA